MNIFLGILLGILVLTAVVTVHEFGHFIIAKRNGVKVNEFGIGFPPKAKTWLHIPAKEAEKYCEKFKFDSIRTERILKKAEKKLEKKGKKRWIWIPLPKDEWYEETEEGLVPKTQKYLVFSLNWFPIGGFCQMDGENNIDTRKGTFGHASLWSKTKILFAGVMMNWILAFVVLTVLAITGLPEMIRNQYHVKDDTSYTIDGFVKVSNINKDSPAEKAGFNKDDIVVSIKAKDEDEIVINDSTQIVEFNEKHAGEEVEYKVKREVELVEEECTKADCEKNKTTGEQTLKVTLNKAEDKPLLGISMATYGSTVTRATWSAPIVGLVTTVQLTGETYRGIGTLIGNIFSGIAKQFSPNEEVRAEGQASIGEAGDSVAGPVGIIGTIFPSAAEGGIVNILLLMAIISISLACMNVLPIPALDGGRWLLIIIFKLLKRPLTPEAENKIVSRAFAVLLILSALITVLDIIKIFR